MTDEENDSGSMSNLAARSAHGFSLVEKRIFAAGLSQLPPCLDHSTLTLAQRSVSVTAADYAETYSINPKHAYDHLRDAADTLFNRYLRYTVETPTGTKERKIRWVGGLIYHHGEGWVEWSFTEEIAPHLFELRKQFTEYRLRQAAALRSVYSWRLLELLQSSRPNREATSGFLTIDVDALRKALEMPESYEYKNIRQRVLDPAVAELSAKDGWIIKWQALKVGRSVEKLTFSWDRDPQEQRELEAPTAAAGPVPSQRRDSQPTRPARSAPSGKPTVKLTRAASEALAKLKHDVGS